MSQASDYAENKIVDHITGKAAFAALTAYVALLTAAAVDSQTGATIPEAGYTNYARKQTAAADWNAASGGSAANANELAFPQCGATGAEIVAFAIVDALTGGNVLTHGVLGTAAYKAVSGITRTGSTATATSTAHGYANGDKVYVTGADQAEYNGVFTISNVTANTFDYTVTGTPATPATFADRLRAKKVTPLAVSNGITPRFSAGQLTVSAD